jgi:hypothetical protein
MSEYNRLVELVTLSLCRNVSVSQGVRWGDAMVAEEIVNLAEAVAKKIICNQHTCRVDVDPDSPLAVAASNYGGSE